MALHACILSVSVPAYCKHEVLNHAAASVDAASAGTIDVNKIISATTATHDINLLFVFLIEPPFSTCFLDILFLPETRPNGHRKKNDHEDA